MGMKIKKRKMKGKCPEEKSQADGSLASLPSIGRRVPNVLVDVRGLPLLLSSQAGAGEAVVDVAIRHSVDGERDALLGVGRDANDALLVGRRVGGGFVSELSVHLAVHGDLSHQQRREQSSSGDGDADPP